MMTMDTQRYQITEAKECLVVLNVCVNFFFFFFFFFFYNLWHKKQRKPMDVMQKSQGPHIRA